MNETRPSGRGSRRSGRRIAATLLFGTVALRASVVLGQAVAEFPTAGSSSSVLLLSAGAGPEERPASLSPLAVGSRVRLQAPTIVEGRVEGMVMEMDESSLLVSADGRASVRVERQAITRLDISTGRHRRALRGMAIGAGIGAVAGLLFTSDSCDNPVFVCTTSVVESGALGTLAGAAYGAGIGALFKTDSWNRVPLELVHVSVAPIRGRGVRLSLSLAW
jgi:hypothetical protein